MKISEAFDAYIKSEVVALGKSFRTAENYRYTKKAVVGYLGDKNLRKISLDDFRNFYLYQLERVQPSTAGLYFLEFRAVVSFVERRGARGPDVSVLRTPKRPKQCPNCLTEAEVEKVIGVISAPMRGRSKTDQLRNRAIVEVLFSSGIRVGELCRLNRADIDNGSFVVVGKSKFPRPCFLSDEAERSLSRYLATRDDSNEALFVSRTGERIRPNSVQSLFRDASRMAKIRVHPHALRHSFATKMLNDGTDIRIIAEFLGHEDLNTTKIYTHVANPELQKIHAEKWKKQRKKCQKTT